jgi:hypothetical protein
VCALRTNEKIIWVEGPKLKLNISAVFEIMLHRSKEIKSADPSVPKHAADRS